MKVLPLLTAGLVGCGSGAALPDGAGAPDAAGPPKVTVYAWYPRDAENGDFYPHPGSTVLFYDASGTLVDRQLTGDDGYARGTAPQGGMVTLIPPDGVDGRWFTWVDVAPDDHLYNSPVYVGPMQPGRAQAATVPRDGDDVDGYAVWASGYAGTGSASPSGNITVHGWLDPDAPVNADVVAQAHHTGGRSRFIVARNVPITGSSIDVSTATWGDGTPLTVTIENIDAGVQDLFATYSITAGGRPVWQSRTDLYSPPGAQFALQQDSPVSIGDGTSLVAQFGGMTTYAVAVNGVGTTVDLAALAPPVAKSVALAGGVAATWDIDGDPARATATMLDMSLQSQRWRVIMPGDRREFRSPAIPSDLPRWAPNAAQVSFVGDTEPAGYAAVRTDVYAHEPLYFAEEVPATPGTYRSSGR